MRTIKFRAWDAEEKYMYGDEVALETLLGRGARERELMQYTGLSDKNGREIYEGDVVRRDKSAYGPGASTDFRVVFDEDEARFRPEFWGYGNWAKESEIIGNIYENPTPKEKQD